LCYWDSETQKKSNCFFASGTVRHIKESRCIFGEWDSEAQERKLKHFRAGGTVRLKKASRCMFGEWDRETQKVEWVHFLLVGQCDTIRRVAAF
jgi:hypothetical protein